VVTSWARDNPSRLGCIELACRLAMIGLTSRVEYGTRSLYQALIVMTSGIEGGVGNGCTRRGD